MWQYGLQPTNPEYNAWSPSFCWTAKTQYFDVYVASDNSINGTGFFATYEIVSGPTSEMQTKLAVEHNGYAPCMDSEWTCFNRKCISQALICNSVDDCGDGSDESNLHHTGCGEENVFYCNFNSNSSLADGLCGLTSIEWQRVEVGRSSLVDHTTAQWGYYMETVQQDSHAEAQLTSAQFELSKNQSYCFGFWYYASSSASLRVYTNSLQMNKRPDWSRMHIPMDIQWTQGQIQLRGPIIFQAVFVAQLSNSDSVVALDDISIVDGECFGDDISCNFENDLCGWIAASSEVIKALNTEINMLWTMSSNKILDHSSSDGSGQYILFNRTAKERNSFAKSEGALVSKPVLLFGLKSMCITFWYILVGSEASLHLKVYDAEGRVFEDFWSSTVSTEGRWTKVHATFNTAGPFQVVLLGVIKGHGESYIAADQISMSPGDCVSKHGNDCPSGYHLCSEIGCVLSSVACSEAVKSYNESTVTDEVLDGVCSPAYFQCVSGEHLCIPKDWVCDTFKDCVDGSDEAIGIGCHGTSAVTARGAPTVTVSSLGCGANMMLCEDGTRCAVMCNGRKECWSGIDETNCTAFHMQPPVTFVPKTSCKQFQCISSTVCVSFSKTCDGNADCPDASDESQLYANCAIRPVSVGLTVGSIIGIAVACVCTLILVIIMVCVLVKRRNKSTPRRRLHHMGDSSVSAIAYLDEPTTIDRHMAALNNMRMPMQNILQLPVYSQQDPNTDNIGYQSETLKQQQRNVPQDPPPPYEFAPILEQMASRENDGEYSGYRPASHYNQPRTTTPGLCDIQHKSHAFAKDISKSQSGSLVESSITPLLGHENNGRMSDARSISQFYDIHHSRMGDNISESDDIIIHQTKPQSPNLLSLSPVSSRFAQGQPTESNYANWASNLPARQPFPNDVQSSSYFTVTRPTSANRITAFNDVNGRKSETKTSKKVMLGTNALSSNRANSRVKDYTENTDVEHSDHIYETLPHMLAQNNTARISANESTHVEPIRSRFKSPSALSSTYKDCLPAEHAESSAYGLSVGKPLWPVSQELFSPMTDRPLPEIPYSDGYRPGTSQVAAANPDLSVPVVLRQKRSTATRPTSWQRTEIPRASYATPDPNERVMPPRKSRTPRMSHCVAQGHSLSRPPHGRQKVPNSASYHDSPMMVAQNSDNHGRLWEPLVGSVHAVCSPTRLQLTPMGTHLYDSNRYFRPIHPPDPSPVNSNSQPLNGDTRLLKESSRSRNSYSQGKETNEFFPPTQV